MTVLPILISSITTILGYTFLFAGVYKLFMIANDLSEIKTLLKENKREREAAAFVKNSECAGHCHHA